MSEKELKKGCYPGIHYAAPYGWINDPNGLVWHDGIYELYYQSNPKDLYWADMTWSHARSRDLLHWEALGAVLYPDETGTVFSGCGLQNSRGLLGLPKDALLFPYTAAGKGDGGYGSSDFTIRMAVSLDGGNTLTRRDGILLDAPAPANRDPKVFWHEESGAYILVLWIEKNDFGIWRSTDLEHFDLSSRISLEGGFECPDLFCLPVTDENGQETGERRWVFWSADGSYYVGEFDGFTFLQTQPVLRAYAGKLPYAAQTWSNVPGERVISIAWLRTLTVQNQYTGVMSLPREFTLVKRGEFFVLCQKLPFEIEQAAAAEYTEERCEDGMTVHFAEESALRIRIAKPDAFTAEFFSDGESALKIGFLPEPRCILIEMGDISEYLFVSHQEDVTDLDLVYDRGILEISAQNGTWLNILDRPTLRSRLCGTCKIQGANDSLQLQTIC